MAELFKDIENIIYNLFQENIRHLPYHNFDSTIRVVNYAKVLAVGEGLDAIDTEALVIAAYFHDVTYQVDFENHEDLAADKCGFYLQEQGKSSVFINKVRAIIQSTDPKKELKTNR